MLRAGIHDLLHLRFKALIEGFHLLIPLCFSLCNLIKLLLNLSGEVVVHDIWEVIHKEVVYYDTNVSWDKFTLISTSHFLFSLGCNLQSKQWINNILALFTLTITFLHIFTLLNRWNRWGVSWWTTDTEFFKFTYKTCFRIAVRTLWITLCWYNFTTFQFLTFMHYWQCMWELLAVFIIISWFVIYFQEAFKSNNFSIRNKLQISGILTIFRLKRYVYCGLLYLCISHLWSNSTLPNKVI